MNSSIELVSPPAAVAAQEINLATAERTYTHWHFALVVLAIFAACRLTYLLWLSPWELVGDEAYYWVQSQHVSLSYAEKGPLLAWIMAGTCRVFGNSEGIVRLPMLVSSVIAAWGVGRLTLATAFGSDRIAVLSVLIFLLIPAFIANGQICTQDGIEVVFIVAFTAIGLRIVRREEGGRSTWLEWLVFYAAMGAGVLLKQSVVLFCSAFVPYAILRAKHLRWRWTMPLQQLMGAVVVGVLCLPILIWDSTHGWPLLRHTLGHLGAGGDQTGKTDRGNSLTWFGGTVGGLVAAIGPVIALMSWASIRAWRDRHTDDARWRDQLWLMCAAWPSVLFFVVLSLFKPVVASWPLPLIVPLVPLAASLLNQEFERATATRLAAPQRTRKPKHSAAIQLWIWTVGYGIGALVLLSFPDVLRLIPIAGPKLDSAILSRLSGSRLKATRIQAALDAHPAVRFVVVPHYQSASLLSFYLHGSATVTSGGGFVGSRLSNFDMWPDTSLDSPSQVGKDMLLISGEPDRWSEGLSFDRIEPIGDGLFVGHHFSGVRVARTDQRER